MKNLIKTAFSRETLQPFTFGVATVLLLEFIIFPGLSVEALLVNVVCATLLVGLVTFTVNYLKSIK